MIRVVVQNGNVFFYRIDQLALAKKANKIRRNKEVDTLRSDLSAERARCEQLEKELERLRRRTVSNDVTGEQDMESALDHPMSDDSSLEFRQVLGPTSTQRINASTRISSKEGSQFMASVTQLSLSSINIPECKPLDGDDEIYRHAYEAWKELLEDTMRLAGVEDEQTKFTLFKIKAGTRLLQIFRNTKSHGDCPDSEIEPFANAMHRLKTYFGSGSDVMFQRRKLALMMQNPGESSLAFITRVGATARLCEYDEEKEMEEIVGTVAEHAVSKDVRVAALKMLNRKGKFSSLVDKVRELDAIQMNEEYFKLKHQRPETASVAAVSAAYPINDRPSFQRQGGSRGGRYQFFNSRRRDSRFNPIRNPRSAGDATVQRHGFREPPTDKRDRCWRCNSVYHLPSECNAVDKVCIGCGQIGHIRRACNNSGLESVRYRGQRQPISTPAEVKSLIPAAVNNVEAKTEHNEDRSEVSEIIDN